MDQERELEEIDGEGQSEGQGKCELGVLEDIGRRALLALCTPFTSSMGSDHGGLWSSLGLAVMSCRVCRYLCVAVHSRCALRCVPHHTLHRRARPIIVMVVPLKRKEIHCNGTAVNLKMHSECFEKFCWLNASLTVFGWAWVQYKH